MPQMIPQGRHRAILVVGMQQTQECLMRGLEFVVVVSQQLVKTGRPPLSVPIDIANPEPIVGPASREIETFFTPTHILLGGCRFRKVNHIATQTDYRHKRPSGVLPRRLQRPSRYGVFLMFSSGVF